MKYSFFAKPDEAVVVHPRSMKHSVLVVAVTVCHGASIMHPTSIICIVHFEHDMKYSFFAKPDEAVVIGHCPMELSLCTHCYNWMKLSCIPEAFANSLPWSCCYVPHKFVAFVSSKHEYSLMKLSL